MARDDSEFLEICEDFADAEGALKHWASTPPDTEIRIARMQEYRILVEELAAEIEQLLDAGDTNASISVASH